MRKAAAVLLLAFLACGAIHFASAQTEPKNYVALGDSITTGLNASSPDHRYVALIAADKKLALTDRGVIAQQACDMADTQVFNSDRPAASGNPVLTEMIGTNDAAAKGVGDYEAVFNECLQAALAWETIPDSSKTLATACAQTGAWTPAADGFAPGQALQTTASGSSLACTIETKGVRPVYGWYRLDDSAYAKFTYAVDGGAPVALSNTAFPPIATLVRGTHGEGFIRITGLKGGTHTIVFTATSNNPLAILGIGTPPADNSCCAIIAGGVPKQIHDGQAAATAAYNQDVINDVTLLAGDGLRVVFVPVRDFLNDSTDMSDQFHPNDTGMDHLAKAFESVWVAPK